MNTGNHVIMTWKEYKAAWEELMKFLEESEKDDEEMI